MYVLHCIFKSQVLVKEMTLIALKIASGKWRLAIQREIPCNIPTPVSKYPLKQRIWFSFIILYAWNFFKDYLSSFKYLLRKKALVSSLLFCSLPTCGGQPFQHLKRCCGANGNQALVWQCPWYGLATSGRLGVVGIWWALLVTAWLY